MEHKLITGGEQFLPFARSRIKALRATGLKYASQQFEIDGCSVKVRIEPGHEYISLSGGGGGYQFFTSPPNYDRYYRGDAVRVYPRNEKLVSEAIGSTLQADTSSPARWKYSPDPLDMSKFMSPNKIWQDQGITEYVYYAKGGKSASGVGTSAFLMSSWGAASPIDSLNINSGIIGLGYDGQFDVNYDLAPTLCEAGSKTAIARAPDADWYRRAAFRVVNHETYGSRKFIVLTDVSNTFHVYPASAPSDSALAGSAYSHQFIKTNVAEAYVKRLAAPLPEWVRNSEGPSRDMDKSDPRQYTQRVPQYTWHFDSTCTRACCVVIEGLTVQPLFDEYKTTRAGDIIESLPGMVELQIDITITGPELEDFTFALTLGRQSRPTVDGEYIMAAEYAWAIPDAAALDDMVVVSAEVGYDSGDYEKFNLSWTETTLDGDPSVRPVCASAHKCLLQVRNYTSGALIRAFVAHETDLPITTSRSGAIDFDAISSGRITEIGTDVLSIDLRSLSFIVQQKHIQYPISYSDDAGTRVGSLNTAGGTQVQRLQVYVMNKLEQEKYLDPGAANNELLATAHADTTARIKFPIAMKMDFVVSTPDHRYQAYGGFVRQVATLRQSCDPYANFYYRYDNYKNNVLGSPEKLDVGAALYAILAAQAFQLDWKACQFTVHPDGHWSALTDPAFYYSGGAAITVMPDLYYVDSGGVAEGMRQGYIDTINIKSKSGGVETDLRTSHREAANSAFGRTLAESEITYTFSIVEAENHKELPATEITSHSQYLHVSGGDASEGVFFLIGAKEQRPGKPRYSYMADIFAIDARSAMFAGQAVASINALVVAGNPRNGHLLMSQFSSLPVGHIDGYYRITYTHKTDARAAAAISTTCRTLGGSRIFY